MWQRGFHNSCEHAQDAQDKTVSGVAAYSALLQSTGGGSSGRPQAGAHSWARPAEGLGAPHCRSDTLAAERSAEFSDKVGIFGSAQ
jgi:hypothetical protein